MLLAAMPDFFGDFSGSPQMLDFSQDRALQTGVVS